MGLPDFANQSLWIVVTGFAVAAVFVWAAGTRLSRYVDRIADRTGIGRAFIGLLLLGSITSLPEIATIATASASGNVALAVNNLLGSVSVNILILALADALLGRDALTSVVPGPSTLMQGVLDILLLAVTAGAIVAGDVLIFGVGGWTTAIFLLVLPGMWLSARYSRKAPWIAADSQPDGPDGRRRDARQAGRRGGQPRNAAAQAAARPAGEEGARQSLTGLVLRTAAAAAVILVAGFVLALTGDAIATKTGIGASLVGFVLVGAGTSLPEVSTVIAAMRLKRYEMAMGDIFGTNLFNLSLLLLADAVYTGGASGGQGGQAGGAPGSQAGQAAGEAATGGGTAGGEEAVLNLAGPFESFALLLGIVLTGIYVVGLLERRDRTVLRMGYDSLAVILTWLGGLVILYTLQPGGA